MCNFWKGVFFKTFNNYGRVAHSIFFILFLVAIHFPKSLQGQCCVLEAQKLTFPYEENIATPSNTCSRDLTFYVGEYIAFLLQPTPQNGVLCCSRSTYLGAINEISISSSTPLPSGLSFAPSEDQPSQGYIYGVPLEPTGDEGVEITVNFGCYGNGDQNNLFFLTQNFTIYVDSASPASSIVEQATLIQNALSSDGDFLFSRRGAEVKKGQINHRAKKNHFNYADAVKWMNVITFQLPESREGIQSFEVYDYSRHLKKPVLIATLPYNPSKGKYKVKHSIEGPCLSYKYKIFTRRLLGEASEPVVLKIKKL